MFDPQLPINLLEHFSYLGVFVLLVLGGVLSPISEEVVLISVGYLIGVGFLNKFIAIPISLLGVFIGDLILFSLSKNIGKYAKWLMTAVQREKLSKYEEFMEKHNKKAVFFLRFIIGLRFLGPMLAGITKVKDGIFRLYDFLAILIYVPVLIFIGYYFNDQLDVLTSKLATLKHSLFILIMAATVVFLSLFFRRKLLNR